MQWKTAGIIEESLKSISLADRTAMGQRCGSSPVGLLFRDNLKRVWEQARLSSLPLICIPSASRSSIARHGSRSLHSHDELRPHSVLDELIGACASSQYRVKLERAQRGLGLQRPRVGLGNRIEAEHSVPKRLRFALTPESFETTIGKM